MNSCHFLRHVTSKIFFQDDDTRNVMTAMVNQTTGALESLKFYAVTKSWFVRAWPILTAKPNGLIKLDERADFRQTVGKIHNSELVLVDKARQRIFDEKDKDKVCPTDENSSHVGDPSLSDSNRENPETTRMKPGLIHARDYFFLGPSAWMIIKEKFGYDGYEISRCCKKVFSQTGQCRIAVALLPGEENTQPLSVGYNEDEMITRLQSTILPLSGRFPYEKVLSIKSNDESTQIQKGTDRTEMTNEVSLVRN